MPGHIAKNAEVMPILSAEEVYFGYTRDTETLRDVSLAVHQGEFLSLVGPNGSGKTTLLRLLDRIYVPRKGGILLDGKNIQNYSRTEIARRVAFVPQDTGVLFPFTVMEMVLMGRSPHCRSFAFENEQDHAIAEEMMTLLDITHLAFQPVTALSGGERQRVFVARALAQQPEIILLDEPNAHLDIAHQIDVFSILKKLNTDDNLTIVSVSHDLNLAASYSDRVAMMVTGTLAGIGTPRDVLTEKRIGEVFQTRVLVDTHPFGSSPRITLHPTQPTEHAYGNLRAH
jgi:cobalamin transport system ATP-binding protein